MHLFFVFSSSPLKGSSIANILYPLLIFFFASNIVLKINSLWACPPLIDEAFSDKLLNRSLSVLNSSSSNKPIALLDFIKLIENNLGEKAELDLLPMQLGDVKRSHANIDKAKSLIGYKPNYNTVVGVNNFCDWFKENLSLVMNLKENN